MVHHQLNLLINIILYVLVPTTSCFHGNLVGIALGESLEFAFNNFKQSDAIHLNFSALTSGIHNGALQVTYDSGSLSTVGVNTSGQIAYGVELELWNPSYNYTTSFNTSFMINMGPMQGEGSRETGGGMAFYLSSVPPTHIPNSHGLHLGLLNSSYAPAFVAIEFDTFEDTPSDPDNNHLGININSTENSVWTGSLTPFNVTLDDFVVGFNTSVWIDYNGNTLELDVYVANQGTVQTVKPTRAFLSRFPIDLRKHLPKNVFVGFSASTGTFKENHCVSNWNFTSTSFPSDTSWRRTLAIALSLVSLALAFIVVFIIRFMVLKVRRKKSLLFLQDLSNLNYGPRRFAYKDLKKATKGFSEECKLGQGGFGAVYKGRLWLDNANKNGGNLQTNVDVAVKVLSQNSKQGEREFKAEILSIGRMRHKNIVQLLGWSYDGRGRRLLLVYEYMPNQSLDKWIHAIGRGGQSLATPSLVSESMNIPMPKKNLDWKGRYHVLKGVASGLVYLHEEWEMVVVHRDLKPSNIMLDAEFNAKLGDFGLARLIKERDTLFGPGVLYDGISGESTQTFNIAGTPGYIAPECIKTGTITKESDVYSFGAVAMQVATGKKLSLENFHWLWSLYENNRLMEAAAGDLMEAHDFDEKQMELVLKLCMACCHPQPSCRPSMRQILHSLASISSCSINSSADSRVSSSLTDSNFQITRPHCFFSVSSHSATTMALDGTLSTFTLGR